MGATRQTWTDAAAAVAAEILQYHAHMPCKLCMLCMHKCMGSTCLGTYSKTFMYGYGCTCSYIYIYICLHNVQLHIHIKVCTLTTYVQWQVDTCYMMHLHALCRRHRSEAMSSTSCSRVPVCRYTRPQSNALSERVRSWLGHAQGCARAMPLFGVPPLDAIQARTSTEILNTHTHDLVDFSAIRAHSS